jgi:hypothetical protein
MVQLAQRHCNRSGRCCSHRPARSNRVLRRLTHMQTLTRNVTSRFVSYFITATAVSRGAIRDSVAYSEACQGERCEYLAKAVTASRGRHRDGIASADAHDSRINSGESLSIHFRAERRLVLPFAAAMESDLPGQCATGLLGNVFDVRLERSLRRRFLLVQLNRTLLRLDGGGDIRAAPHSQVLRSPAPLDERRCDGAHPSASKRHRRRNREGRLVPRFG